MSALKKALCVSACFLAIPCVQAEDARYFYNRPVDESSLEFFYTRTHSTTSSDDQLPLVGINAKFDTLTLHYRYYTEFGDQAGFWSVQVPSVEIKAADDNDPFGDTRETGVGDPTLSIAGHFYGKPAVSHYDYESWQERAALGWAFGVTLPLGEYDASSLVNAGNNRWIARAALQGEQPTRAGLLDVSLAVNVFGANDEFWGAWNLQQRPLFEFNANMSHDLSHGIWWWWGAQGHYGGRSFVDHVLCTKARDYGEQCNDGEFVDGISFSDTQKDWRANIGIHIEIAGGVMDLVLQRVISDTDGDREVEVGKFAYSTRW